VARILRRQRAGTNHDPLLLTKNLLSPKNLPRASAGTAYGHGRWAAGRAALLGPKGIVPGCALGLVTGLGWIAIDRMHQRRRRSADPENPPGRSAANGVSRQGVTDL